ncbi:glucuronate isomerase [Paenibacillus sp. JTLBN-2024]
MNRKLATRRSGAAASSKIQTSKSSARPTTRRIPWNIISCSEKRSRTSKVLPAFRPDKALNIDAPGFIEWLGRLEQAAGVQVRSYAALTEALEAARRLFP